MGRPGAIINISGTTPVDDPEYRYKMPTIYGKIEGKGNGIKTVLPNLSDVAQALKRDSAEVNKFFGTELGAQTTYSSDSDRAVVNGAHTDATLQGLMHKYIELFVLCPNCRLPETEYKIKSGAVYHKCMACGAKEMVDMSHKLCTFILGQDKKAKQDAKKSGKKDKEKKDKDKKKDKKDGSGSDEEKKKEKKDKKSKDKKKDKKDKKKSKSKDEQDEPLSGEEDDNPTEDLSDENALKLAIEALQQFLSTNPDASPTSIAEKVVNEQMASGLKSQDRIHIYIRAAFDPVDCIKTKSIEKNASTISKITQGKNVMERHLISAFEGLFVDEPKKFAVALKQLFDEEVLEEDTILEWAGEGRTDYTLDVVDEDRRAALRGEAEPVVCWLMEDDSSDEDEDSD